MATHPVEQILPALNRKIDYKANPVFPTIASALMAFKPTMRTIGQSAYIIDQKVVYRFVDGTTDACFVPEVTGGVIPGVCNTWLLD
jgi:hypothetical protein